MRNKNIRLLISVSAILGVLSIIFFYHFFNAWKGSLDEQKKLQKDQIHILNKQFENKVLLSLTYVRDRILKVQGSNYFASLEPVNMINPNYYLVPVPDTADMNLIEDFIKIEFQNDNIEENYMIGLYDCFDNTYVDKSENTPGLLTNYKFEPITWSDYEGHYFAVLFPERIADISAIDRKNFSYMSVAFILIFILILILFTYNLLVIFRQKRVSEIKNDFINNMTHELKTPIATISLSSEMIKNPRVMEHPEKVKHYAQVIFDENKRLKMVVDRVLNIAKLEKGDVQLEFEVIHYHQIIEKAIASCLIKTQNDILFTQSLNAQNDLIEGDRVHLENIVNNLIDNALKYAKEQPNISINSFNNNGYFVLEIEDKGLGIDSKHIKHIFEKFYRVPTGNVHNVKGFGLGLYYVKQMVDKHSGKISISSELDVYTKVTLQFPLYHD